MSVGFLPAAAATRIRDVLIPRGFATAKQIGNVQTITFHRDNDSGTDVVVGPYEVLVVISSGGAPQQGADQSTAFVGVAGEFRKESPFAVSRGDRFCLTDGPCGAITTDPIDRGAFLGAPFQIEL